MNSMSPCCSPLSTRARSWYRQASILLALVAWTIGVDLLGAAPITPQSVCTAPHCAFLPLIAMPLRVHITSLRGFGGCKAQCYILSSVLEPTGTRPVYEVTDWR